MSTAELQETEQAILAACLDDPTAVDNARALGLVTEHFQVRGHQALWKGMVEDRSVGIGPDEATLFDRHELDVGNGRPFVDLSDLHQHVSALRNRRSKPAHLESYVNRLAEQRSRVRLAQMAKLVAMMIDENEPTAEAIEAAEQGLIEAARSRRAGFVFSQLGPAVSRAWDHLERVRRGEVEDTQIKTGIEALDKILKLRPKHYSVWAGRPSMGKTQAVLSALRNIAARDVPVLMCSLEMDLDSLAERVVSSEEHTGSRNRIEAISWWSVLPFYIDDRSYTLDDVCSSIRLHVLRYGIKVAAIDYLQIVSCPHNPSREQQIAEASRRFKALAKETGITLILLAQLNRGVESRRDKRPMMSDLRESGAVEQDADSIVMLYRDIYYHKSTKKPDELEAIVRKQRNGKVGTAFAWYRVGGWVKNPPTAQDLWESGR